MVVIDIDDTNLTHARENIDRNRVSNRIRTFKTKPDGPLIALKEVDLDGYEPSAQVVPNLLTILVLTLQCVILHSTLQTPNYWPQLPPNPVLLTALVQVPRSRW